MSASRSEFAVKGISNVSLSQNHPSKINPSFVGLSGMFTVFDPSYVILSTNDPPLVLKLISKLTALLLHPTNKKVINEMIRTDNGLN